jgi:hypothetical protein
VCVLCPRSAEATTAALDAAAAPVPHSLLSLHLPFRVSEQLQQQQYPQQPQRHASPPRSSPEALSQLLLLGAVHPALAPHVVPPYYTPVHSAAAASAEAARAAVAAATAGIAAACAHTAHHPSHTPRASHVFAAYRQLTTSGGVCELPLLGGTEDVVLVDVHYNGTFIELVPWRGRVLWDIAPWGDWRVSAASDTHEAHIVATCAPQDGTTLRAPTAKGVAGGAGCAVHAAGNYTTRVHSDAC